MNEKILKGIFSLSGASITIGLIGFMSGLVGLFVDVNAQMSIKWLLFVLLLETSLILILLKVVYDLTQETRPPPPFEHPIKYVPEENIFIIRKNENFHNSIVVGCYAQMDEVDRLAYLGIVHLVQDRIIQIKIVNDYFVLPRIPLTQEELKNIFIRSVVPVTALQQFNTMENTNV